jgi:hypothetical protein
MHAGVVQRIISLLLLTWPPITSTITTPSLNLRHPTVQSPSFATKLHCHAIDNVHAIGLQGLQGWPTARVSG